MTKKKKEINFENLLAEAEEAVRQLESGELALEDSMAQYEVGVSNLKQCADLILKAQEKVQLLVAKNGGSTELQDFTETEES